MAHDVAEATGIERPPRGREEVPVQLSRLLEGHEHVLREARHFAKAADERGGRRDERHPGERRDPDQRAQVWFIAEHLVDAPLVRAEGD